MEALQNLLQQTVNGIQLGSVYALIAVGYTMVYGVLQFINFAHGDVYMVGAYIGFFAITATFLSHFPPVMQGSITLLLCMTGCALLGNFIERLAYRPLRNGLSGRDAFPWALFWSLYVMLFLGKWLSSRSVLPAWIVFTVTFFVSLVSLSALFKLSFSKLSKHLKPSSDRLTALITAIGISFLLENQGVALFTTTPRQIQLKGIANDIHLRLSAFKYYSGNKLHVVGVRISGGEITVLAAAIILMSFLIYLVGHTRTGRAIRAVSLDKDAAALMGIPADKIIGLTFIIGSSLAGAAGFLNHEVSGISFDSNIGIALGLKAFVAAVLGGIGSIEGAVVGGLLMGVAESFTGGSVLSSLKDAVSFVILIAILLLRPGGILGSNVQEKV